MSDIESKQRSAIHGFTTIRKGPKELFNNRSVQGSINFTFIISNRNYILISMASHGEGTSRSEGVRAISLPIVPSTPQKQLF